MYVVTKRVNGSYRHLAADGCWVTKFEDAYQMQMQKRANEYLVQYCEETESDIKEFFLFYKECEDSYKDSKKSDAKDKSIKEE
jgi:hypothetical protein